MNHPPGHRVILPLHRFPQPLEAQGLDLVEQFAPVYEAHIVETQAAADALFVEEPTEDQQTALDNGYIARLEEGFRIVYLGPLEDSQVAILGS